MENRINSSSVHQDRFAEANTAAQWRIQHGEPAQHIETAKTCNATLREDMVAKIAELQSWFARQPLR